jgi:hypothetical protein
VGNILYKHSPLANPRLCSSLWKAIRNGRGLVGHFGHIGRPLTQCELYWDVAPGREIVVVQKWSENLIVLVSGKLYLDLSLL